MALAIHLSDYRERGVVNFKAVLAVPGSERIPTLSKSKEGYSRLLIALGASIQSAMSNFNLRYGLNEDQIVELASQIIATSHEDYLSLEDVLLFLQELVSGKAGKVYDRMDIPTFFELFETYRQRRHEELIHFRYEQSVNHKALGPIERSSEDVDKESHREALRDHLKNLYKNADGS